MHMISYAYKTKNRKEEDIIYAHNCSEKDLGIRFYCPNPNCDAYMYLCNLKNPDIRPYFRATQKSHPHIKDCKYTKISFKIEDFDETTFDFEKATESVMKPSRTGQESTTRGETGQKRRRKLPPHTIKQIYELAISNSIDFEYNGIKMWQLLADKRSAHIYYKGVFRKCLVEGFFAGFNTNKNYIRMKYFINDSNLHYLRLKFYDNEVFNKTIKVFLEAKPLPVVVWGDWKPENNYFQTIIHSLNQIYVPKK